MRTLKIDDLYVIAYISYFKNPKGEAEVYQKIFLTEEEAHEYAKSLKFSNYSVTRAFIDEKNGK